MEWQLLLDAIIMFVVGFSTDVLLLALWTIHLTQKNKKVAANYSVLTGICSLLFLNTFLVSKSLAIFWLAGLWLGTYYAEQLEEFIKNWSKT